MSSTHRSNSELDHVCIQNRRLSSLLYLKSFVDIDCVWLSHSSDHRRGSIGDRYYCCGCGLVVVVVVVCRRNVTIQTESLDGSEARFVLSFLIVRLRPWFVAAGSVVVSSVIISSSRR